VTSGFTVPNLFMGVCIWGGGVFLFPHPFLMGFVEGTETCRQCCESGMFIPDPVFFSIPDPTQKRTGTKKDLNQLTQNISMFNQKLLLSSQKYNWIRELGSGKNIPDPKVKKHRIPDPKHCLQR
jgi:hypothetical protein